MGNSQSSQGSRPDGETQQQYRVRYSPGLSTQHSQTQQQGNSNSVQHAAPASPSLGNPPAQPQPVSNQSNSQQLQQQSRVLVDIRGANLDGSNYAVWVERQPARRQRLAAAEAMEGSMVFLSSTVQALGGVLVTVLTIQKLVEELKFIRGLRRSNNNRNGSKSGKSSAAAAGTSNSAADPHLGLPKHLAEQLHRCSSKPGLLETSRTSNDTSSAGSTAQQSAWSSIAGLQNVKMLLQEVTVLPLLRPDLFSGVRSPPSAVLLYGPPGTGKTLLAKAVAAASGAAFFPVTGSSVLSKWYGESEQNVRRLFEEAAAAAPSVIFIDEVDSLLSKRSGAGADAAGGAGEASRRVTNEFLAYIDGIASSSSSNRGSHQQQKHHPVAAGRVVVIAATNAPWDLDEAALSRFSARLMVPLPDAAARQAILAGAMTGVATLLQDSHFKQVAEQADGLSGRDLVSVCREASMRPMRELFGNRILEGQAPRHCQQQQQLIAAVTCALQQGGSSRKLRRGLERWKRQQGAAADWCDVDAIITAAEQGAMRLQATDIEQHQQQHSAEQQQPEPQALQLFSSPGCTQPSSSLQEGQHCQQQPVSQQLVSQMLDNHHHQDCTSCCANTSELHAAGRPCADSSSTKQQPWHSAGGCGCHSNSKDAEAVSNLDGSPAVTQHQDVVSSNLCRHNSSSQAQVELRSHPVTLSEGDTCDSKPTPPKPNGGSTKQDQNRTRNQQAQQMTTPAAGGLKIGEPSLSSWTLDELIALPAESIRPVIVDDLLAALKQVGRAENLVLSKYDEWAQQYGAGPGEGTRSGQAWKWMPMYT